MNLKREREPGKSPGAAAASASGAQAGPESTCQCQPAGAPGRRATQAELEKMTGAQQPTRAVTVTRNGRRQASSSHHVTRSRALLAQPHCTEWVGSSSTRIYYSYYY
eukprot:1446582-Rhodomonas_salina.1